MMQLSQTLKVTHNNDQRIVSCIHCDHNFGPLSENWKNTASTNEKAMNKLGGPYTTGDDVLLRTFNCPGCGILLDTELAMPGDPFLEDKLFVDD